MSYHLDIIPTKIGRGVHRRILMLTDLEFDCVIHSLERRN
jgi:hypothetical protein